MTAANTAVTSTENTTPRLSRRPDERAIKTFAKAKLKAEASANPCPSSASLTARRPCVANCDKQTAPGQKA